MRNHSSVCVYVYMCNIIFTYESFKAAIIRFEARIFLDIHLSLKSNKKIGKTK